MPIVSEIYPVVIGVDTHAATHTFAVVDGSTGAVGDQATFPVTPAGLRRACGWIDRHVPGPQQALVVVEGVGSYGAQLTEQLSSAGYRVVEAPTMARSQMRGVGKTDLLDAVRIARAVLGLATDRLRIPRADGDRAALRVLVVAREQMSAERTRAVNALTALLRSMELDIDARRALTKTQIRTMAAWRTRTEPLALTTARAEARRLAQRILALDEELADNRKLITDLVSGYAPALLVLPGVGAVVAATVLLAWSHPGRLRSEAAMASLAGTCPIPASSGKTTRHRLNRGGDRRLNRAINTIALVRMGRDPLTRAYVARRTTEGRTKKEIMRSLKRYITRQLYRNLQAHLALSAT